MNRDEAAAKLRAFIAPHADGADDVDRMINAIESSVRRFAEGRSNPEVREQARALAKAAKTYREAIEKSDFIWSWLLSGKRGADSRSATLSEAKKVEDGALALAGRLKTEKKQPDEIRTALLYELAEYFNIVSGTVATPSNSADFPRNKPGTKFGYFVQLALSASEHASMTKVKSLISAPQSFIRDASKAAKDRATNRPNPAG